METLWQRLKQVAQMTLEAECAGELWTGQGRVDVHTSDCGKELVFQEAGAWHATQGNVQPFSNLYFWSFDFLKNVFLLHRKRAEAEDPELLARFVQNVACHTSGTRWKQEEPHLCGDDCYTVLLELRSDALSLDWTIRGPKKKDQVRITYI